MDRIIILIPSVIVAFLDRAKECGVRRRAKARYRAIGPALRARNRAHRRQLAEEKAKWARLQNGQGTDKAYCAAITVKERAKMSINGS
ncbi:hypothetical protein niasHT_014453 [Heterodera trifolii]|uniref:Uncharacterized protein n=1 Tax=Heterodera trifolii TaxID=157864 RepID=A0ABD2KZQ1_9BILA